jgi:SPX domain protein involved in polyphosphate accumulation
MTPRYEFKIPCASALLPEIEAWVHLHPAHWRVSYPPRQVNNIYFDSFDLQSLNANLGSVEERQKLRLRWYGAALASVTAAQLELKCRQGAAGWKETAPFAGVLRLESLPWSALMATLRQGLDARAQHWLACYTQPILINSYQRAYYETPDGELRLTLDTRLRAYTQRFTAYPNLHQQVLQPDVMIVELKSPTHDAAVRWVTALLASFPARVERFSKYLHGVLAAPEFEGVFA